MTMTIAPGHPRAGAAEAVRTTPPAARPAGGPVRFPRKVDLFGGVLMTPTTYDEAVDVLLRAAEAGQPATADFAAVHVLATASRDATFRATVNALDLVAPDGQPVRWAMNFFH